MTFADLVPGESDRAFISGRTGSGKSYLAKRLMKYVRDRHGNLRERAFALVYDAKGMLDWAKRDPRQKRKEANAAGWFRVTTFRALLKCANDHKRYPKVIYAPVAGELRDVDLHEAFFRLAYERRNTTVYVDEVGAVVQGRIYPPSYHAILTRGRELGVPIISATQRPVEIPQTLMSESDVFYTFHLQMEQDQDKIAKMIPVDPDAIADLQKRFFIFYRVGESEASRHTLTKSASTEG